MGRAVEGNDISGRAFGALLAALLVFQLLCGLWHIGYPFVDGRYHYNWGPPFWLLHAEDIHAVGLAATYGGLSGYESHPQLIAPVILFWTDAFGYSETSIRMLSLSLTMLATAFLALAARSFLGRRRALYVALFFAALPLIYIYGKKLDQETLVIVFLALSVWGFSLASVRKKTALALVALGSLGMMLSDWSGAFFALALPVAALAAWGWRERMRDVIAFAFASWTAAGVGLCMYVAQTYFQEGAPGGTAFIQGFIHLWKYRAGLASDSVTWLQWLSHEGTYISVNFTAPLFVAALAAIGWAVFRSREGEADRVRECAYFAAAIFFGSLGYMLVVPQASALHVYYQYYWSIPCALGLVFGIDMAAAYAPYRLRVWVTRVLVAAVFAALAGTAAYQYHKLLFVDSWGDPSDIDIVKLVKNIPHSQQVVAVNPDPGALAWFENPNMKYYAGRDIDRAVLTGTSVPEADWMLMPRAVIPDFISVMDADPRYGPSFVLQAECGDNLCLSRIAPASAAQ